MSLVTSWKATQARNGYISILQRNTSQDRPAERISRCQGKHGKIHAEKKDNYSGLKSSGQTLSHVKRDNMGRLAMLLCISKGQYLQAAIFFRARISDTLPSTTPQNATCWKRHAG